MVAIMAGCVFSEFLCFLQNNYGKVPKTNLVGSISSFYTEDELVTAKACLFDFAESISDIDNLPRNKVRKTGDAKRRLDTEDMLALFETLDRNKVVMPTFGAANLRRLPPLSASDVDAYKLAITVSELSKQVGDLQATVQTLLGNQQMLVVPTASTSTMETESVTVVQSSKAAGDKEVASTTPAFSDLFLMKDAGGEWFPVQRKPKKTTVVRKIIGSGDPDKFSVKAVKPEDRGRTWHVFAGRMDPSTQACDVKEQLISGGIRVVGCTQLPRKEKWQEKYSAFRVIVDMEDKDTVFNESLWPAGVDVRDWWFKSQ